MGPSPSDVGDRNMDPGSLEGSVHAHDTHEQDMDAGGVEGGVHADDSHDEDMNPAGVEGSVEGGLPGDVTVMGNGPGSEARLAGSAAENLGSVASHLSLDVCGDCGLIPCMCGPTPQVIPVSAGETGQRQGQGQRQR